ncbi:MAG: CHAT domain-containing tetratricopeptide repeat protein [Bryobacteraceae bacterium]
MTRPSSVRALRLLIAAALVARGVFGQQNTSPIIPGTPIDREIRPGDSHTYRLAVQSGQFVHVTATQVGTDIAIRVTQPGGTTFTEVDRLPYEGVEDFPWIATGAGDCVIEIRAGAQAKTGSYRVEAAGRAPTGQDRSRVAAFNASWIDAQKLRARQSAEAYREALGKYELAAAEFHKAGDPRWEAHALTEWAWVLDRLGDHAKARDLLEQSLALHRRGTGERHSLAVNLSGLGAMYNSLGENLRAIALHEQSLQIRRAAGDRRGEATELSSIGSSYTNLSNFAKAIEYLTQSVAIRRDLNDRPGEVVSLINLGGAHFSAGDYQAALESYTAAWKLSSTGSNRGHEAIATVAMGRSYYALGNSERAWEFWKRAETMLRQVGDQAGLGTVLYLMGNAEARRSEHKRALGYLDESLALYTKTSRPVSQAIALSALCRSLLALNQAENAQARAVEGIALSRKAGSKLNLGTSLDCNGRVELARGNHEGARSLLLEALDVLREAGAREDQTSTLMTLAKVERARGNLAEGLRYVEQATALFESMRVQVNRPDLRASYRASRSDRVDLHAELLMEMHRKEPNAGYAERAFNVTEQWRARSLAEMIAETRVELRQELTPEQRLREDKLLASINDVQRELFREKAPEDRQLQLKQQLSAAERELDVFQNELRRGGNRYAAGQYAEAFNAERIRRQMLDPNTVLIEYALGEKQSYAWALTASGVSNAVLPPRNEIERSVEAYRRLLAERVSALTVTAALARLDHHGKQLYQMLVAPVEAALASKTRVVIVPDGALSYLPFEALTGGSRLIERFSISYAPSASTLAALQERERRRSASVRTLLAFGDPEYPQSMNSPPALAGLVERGFAFTRLPNSRGEVAAIRALFEPRASRVYLGPEAQESSLKTETLDKYSYVHFAAHGYFDEERPSRSGIVLSPGSESAEDGVLQGPEIMRLRLNADLVTLSACQTGLGTLLAGEGVMGLARAFFYAGAQSLVVSLWNVNDAATSELMKRFYGNLKGGMNRDEALRKAKIAIMKTPSSPWRHPYYWAPFVFVGDPGQAPPARR